MRAQILSPSERITKQKIVQFLKEGWQVLSILQICLSSNWMHKLVSECLFVFLLLLDYMSLKMVDITSYTYWLSRLFTSLSCLCTDTNFWCWILWQRAGLTGTNKDVTNAPLRLCHCYMTKHIPTCMLQIWRFLFIVFFFFINCLRPFLIGTNRPFVQSLLWNKWCSLEEFQTINQFIDMHTCMIQVHW